MELSSDTQKLVASAQAGAQDVFNSLFSRHRKRLKSLVRARLDPRLYKRLDDSDIVQETYLEASRRLDGYLADPPMSFFLWLRWIAKEKVLQQHRKHLFSQKRGVASEVTPPAHSGSRDFLSEVAGVGLSPSRELANSELAQALRQVLGQLGETDRSLIVWRHFEGLTAEETAELLEISTAAAGKRYVRALRKLRERLREAGVRSV